MRGKRKKKEKGGGICLRQGGPRKKVGSAAE